MVNINLSSFLKNKYFRIIFVLFGILFLVFAVNNLFLSSKFSELKNYELNQYEYIPTLNGQCIYETKEIASWVKKTTIDTFEIVLNPEIGFFDFKCLGQISGSSLLQNYKIDSNIKNIDLVVYPTFLLSHLLIVLFIISIRKKSISIDKDYVTFLFASSLLINQFSSTQIFFDSYSWIFLMLITAFIDKLSSDNKYLLLFIVFLFAINPLNIFLVFYLFFLYIKVDLKILKLKFIKLKMNDLIRIYMTLSFLIYFLYFLNSKMLFIDNLHVFFFTRADQFGDVLKLIYSFTHIFSIEDLLAMQVPNNWIYENPYNTVSYLEGATLNMGTTPLTIIYLNLTAKISKFFLLDYRVPVLSSAVLLVIFFVKYFKSADYKKNLSLFLLISYPFLFLIDRGNIMAGICVLCLYIIFEKFLQKNKFSNIDILLFIIASSIRPNLLVFGLLFLTDSSLKKSVLKFFKIGTIFIFANIIFYNFAMLIFPGYTFRKFNIILDVYFGNGTHFIEWNSSFYGLLNNLYSLVFGSLFTSKILVYYIATIFLFVLLVSFRLYKKEKITEINLVICISSVSILASHPIADYHLFLFTIILILIFQYEKTDLQYSTILILILLLPKFHIISSVLNIPNILNAVIMCILISQNIKADKKNFKSNEFVNLLD